MAIGVEWLHIGDVQGCGVRQVKPFPQADKIRKGAVPGRSPGTGHTAPTYLVGPCGI